MIVCEISVLICVGPRRASATLCVGNPGLSCLCVRPLHSLCQDSAPGVRPRRVGGSALSVSGPDILCNEARRSCPGTLSLFSSGFMSGPRGALSPLAVSALSLFVSCSRIRPPSCALPLFRPGLAGSDGWHAHLGFRAPPIRRSPPTCIQSWGPQLRAS